jgi:hypothetical protein
MNVRRGFARLYLVLAVVAFGWALLKLFQQRNDNNTQLRRQYNGCVDGRLEPHAGQSDDGSPVLVFPSLPKRSWKLFYNSDGVPDYVPQDGVDFAEWQARVRLEAEWSAGRKVAAEKARPAVEKYCAGVWKRARWFSSLIEVGEACLAILALVAGYWALIWTAVIIRWIYDGFRQTA